MWFVTRRRDFLFVTSYTNIQSIPHSSEMCSSALTHPSAHTHTPHTHTHTQTWSSGQADAAQRPGKAVWGFGALLKGLTSVMVLKVERTIIIHSTDNSCWSRDLNPQPQVTSLSIRATLPSKQLHFLMQQLKVLATSKSLYYNL